MATRNSPLPLAELETALHRFANRYSLRLGYADELADVRRQLDRLPVEAIAVASRSIPVAARLHRSAAVDEQGIAARAMPWAVRQLIAGDGERLAHDPELAPLFLFHGDGRVREAALRQLDDGLPSPFLFAALLWRLNDWAVPVRLAAADCARRNIPGTSPDVIADAALGMITRLRSWQRWQSERALLDEAFDRPDVAERLAERIIARPSGKVAACLRLLTARPRLDAHLERIAHEAVQPAVRTVALRALIDAEARWPAGFEREWIDKSMGLSRRVMRFHHRPLSVSPDRLSMIARGLADPAAAVRRMALEAVIRHLAETPEARAFAHRLSADPSPSVRERALFLLRDAVE